MLDAVLDALPQPLLLVAAGGQVVLVNRPARRELGLEDDQVATRARVTLDTFVRAPRLDTLPPGAWPWAVPDSRGAWHGTAALTGRAGGHRVDVVIWPVEPGAGHFLLTWSTQADAPGTTDVGGHQAELVVSADRYRALVEQAPLAIFINRNDRIEFVNPAAVALFGARSTEDLIGKSPMVLAHPDSRALVADRIAELRQGRDVPLVDARIVRVDGTARDVEVTASRFRDRDGPGIQVILHDVTERVRAVAEVQRLTRLYAALSHVNEAIVRVGDRDDLLREVCRALVEQGGFRMAWIGLVDPARRQIDVVASHGDATGYLAGIVLSTDEARPEGHGPAGIAIREGHPYISNDFQHDPRTAPWMDRVKRAGWQSSAALPIRFAGRIVGSLMVYATEAGYFGEREIALLEETARDVSFALDHLDDENRLREAEERFRTVADFTGDWEYWLGPDGRFIYISPACERVTGYPRDQFEADPDLLLRVVHPDDRGPVRAHMSGYLVTGDREEMARLEYRIVTRQGEVRWIDHVCRAVVRPDGRYLGRRASSRDVTDRKRLEDELRQVQKLEAVGRLAGGVAHDFNNMLGVIMGESELALLDADVPPPARPYFEAIQAAARKSAELTQQLLAFARRQVASPKVLDLNETVSGMLKMLRRLIGEDIELQWHPAGGLWPVRLDPSQVDQVLANLVINARDAMAGTGRLTIETANARLDQAFCANHPDVSPGDYVLIAVTDTGVGMTPEVLDRAFEPFFTTKPSGKGTGLGLSTVYGIVTQNKGVVVALSTPGAGTTVKIWLPRDQAGAEGTGQDREPELPRGTETVLLVEDSEQLVNLASRMLRGLGYSVLTATSPSQALELAAQHARAIRLLVTDVVMPEMNGKELAARLSAIVPDLRCLFMSGYTSDVIADHGVLEPGVHFVHKPFSLEALARGVRSALELGPANP